MKYTNGERDIPHESRVKTNVWYVIMSFGLVCGLFGRFAERADLEMYACDTRYALAESNWSVFFHS